MERQVKWVKKMFTFNLPTRIEFGPGLLAQVGQLLAGEFGSGRVLVVSDPGIIAAGLVDRAVKSLRNYSYHFKLFDQISPNPRDYECEAGSVEAKKFGATVVIAIGGGSVIDAAKAIALLNTHEGLLKDYEGKDKIIGPVTPLVAVPTSAGTGSEVTRSAVITDSREHYKMTVKDIRLAPALAVVDPEATYSLPPQLTASTGMDALVHAIEAYTCREANAMSDHFALAAMEQICPALPRAFEDGRNEQARWSMMFGSVLAGLAFSHADVAAVHCMAEAVGGMYDLAHGVANSIFLPVVTEFNASADPERHARVARSCGFADKVAEDSEAVQLLVKGLYRLARQLAIPRFNQFEFVNPEHFPVLSRTAALNGSTASNSRQLGENEYLDLFHAAYAR